MKEKKLNTEYGVSHLEFGNSSSVIRYSFVLLLLCASLCGCSATSPYIWAQQEELPSLEDISASYHQTKLERSGALDVLHTIHNPEYELLSQGRSVVASLGQGKQGYRTWFNMVAFDQNKLTAKRKYFFVVDEKVKRLPNEPKRWVFEPKRGLMFNSEMVFEKEMLDRPYITENERLIDILRQVLRYVRRDIAELGQGAGGPGSDNGMLGVCGLLINQVFETILHTLNKSPAMAARLGTAKGVKFDHINFGQGRARMVVEGDIITVKIGLGVFAAMVQGPTPRLTAEKAIDTNQ